MTTTTAPDPRRPRLNILQVLGSVVAAFLGIQSSEHRRRDFTQGDPRVFFVVALLMTGVVVLVFFAAVKIVLHFAHAPL